MPLEYKAGLTSWGVTEGSSHDDGRRRQVMRTRLWIIACMTALFAFVGSGVLAQDRGQNQNSQNRQYHTRFDQHDQQITRDWYNQHHDNAPVGLREQDRVSSDRESQFQQGNVLPRDLQRQEHPIPRDLYRQLPPPPRNHRYVAVGGHVVQLDNRHRVQDVIHLEQDH
jgi:Ni/Co efflux regulator RcnB